MAQKNKNQTEKKSQEVLISPSHSGRERLGDLTPSQAEGEDDDAETLDSPQSKTR